MAEYVSAIGDGGLVIPIIETEDALVSIAEILRVDGVQAIFIGTGDLSAARGRVGQWLAPEVRHDVEEVQRCAQEKGIAVGIVASASADIAYCRESGVRMLGLGYDTDCLIAGMQQRMATAKGNGERV
jgi:2-keto-3-deoxy-L-rhamnonate aldolase RhmA